MLTYASLPERKAASRTDDVFFAQLRRKEFARLDKTGQAYLDYTGSALYSERQIRAYAALLERSVFGNPHSESQPSQASTEIIESARRALLAFLDAPPDEYTLCFTANASAAIKLVAEGHDFGRNGSLVLSADNHNSMNGIREYAKRAGASVQYLPLDRELRLARPDLYLREITGGDTSLFGFPAQSNFSGVKHPLELVNVARASGYKVLVDAAAFLPTNPLSLRDTPADYVALSMYKIFGFPTGVGALVARKESLARLRRPWFAGGTVEYASVQNDKHQLREYEAGFEDGTPSFLGIAALADGFSFMADVNISRLSEHVMALTAELLDRLQSLRYRDGSPSVRVYGPTDLDHRGATVTFNVLTRDGKAIPYIEVERKARKEGVAIRGGCFCNPGASEAAFRFPAELAAGCFEESARKGFTIDRFAGCLGPGFAVGAVRVSPGLATNREDIDRLLEVVQSFC